MSLLNEMLRNLDRRRQTPGPDGEIIVESQVAVQTSRVSMWIIAAMLAVAIGVGFGVNKYQLFNKGGSSKSPVLPEPVAIAASDASMQKGSGAGSEKASATDVTEAEIIRPAPPEREANLILESTQLAGTDAAQIDPISSSQQLPAQKLQLPAEPLQSSQSLPQPESDSLQQIAEESTPSSVTVGNIAPVNYNASHGADVILRQPADFYAVQIMAMLEEYKILKYAKKVSLHNPLYVKTQSKGRIWYVLLLGIYPDRPSAVAAMDEWTSTRMLSITPWIRQLAPLQDTILREDSLLETILTRNDLDNRHEKEIQGLLKEAESALSRERLSSPDEDNAYDRYQAILALVPDHPLALAGMDRIVSIYLKLARGYIDSGNRARARILIERAAGIGGQRSSITALQEQLEGSTESGQEQLAVLPSAGGKSTGPDSLEVNVRQNSARQKSEKALLQEVGSLLSRNALNEARDLLEEFLVIHPDSIASIRRLFGLYLQLNELDMAAQLLNQSSQLPHDIALELGAQIKVHEGDLNGAIRMLETTTPGYGATGYYALLAGLYQKTGRFREAANHYRQLLRSAPEQGAYWLGLAVSLDSLKDQGALVAFRHASESKQYHGDVQQYIEQRIGALSTLPGIYD